MLLRVEPLLQVRQPLHVLLEHRASRVLADIAGVGAIVRGDAKGGRIIDATAVEEFRGFHQHAPAAEDQSPLHPRSGPRKHPHRGVQRPLIRPASISTRLKRRASAPPAQA